MAGDWMKVEKNTPDKPEVYAIADLLSIDPDAVFGKCFRVWGWFDSNTTNGKANGVCVSKNLIDRLVSVHGFADAMLSVGWLVEDGTGVAASNFERHNGETAKKRALTAKRVAKHSEKTNANTNAELTLDALPREEKRREDISKPNGLDSVLPKKGTQLPDGFKPNDTGIRYAEARNIDTEVEFESFCNWHKAKGTLMKDWQAAWRTWCDKAQQFQAKGGKAASESFFERDQRSKADRISQFTGQAPRPTGNVIDVTPTARRIGGAK